jgi:hypothetical protein
VKVKGFYLFSYDFFLPYESVNPMEFDLVLTLGSPSFEHTEVQSSERANRFVADRVGLDVCAGVVFLCHAYTLPQLRQNTRIFFAIVQSIFVDGYPPLFEKIQTSV